MRGEERYGKVELPKEIRGKDRGLKRPAYRIKPMDQELPLSPFFLIAA